MSTLTTDAQSKILSKILAEASELKSLAEAAKKSLSYNHFASTGVIIDDTIASCDECTTAVYSSLRVITMLEFVDTTALDTQSTVKRPSRTTSSNDYLMWIRASQSNISSLWSTLAAGVTGAVLTTSNARITRHTNCVTAIKTLQALPGTI